MTGARSVMEDKGEVHVVHLYPRQMSIYGDLGNTRAILIRLRRHGYATVLHDHHPGADFPEQAHLLLGGGGQDSGQARVEADLAAALVGTARLTRSHRGAKLTQ